MDTAGKDSLIREVFKEFNVRGIVVHSFKVPTELERKHDYLWRHYIALPAKGKFGIFNRTGKSVTDKSTILKNTLLKMVLLFLNSF